MVNTQYNSVASTKTKKKRKEICQLALDSFEAVRPFINVFDCGIIGPTGPFHLISKEDWRLYKRYKAGERKLTYPGDVPFNPYLDVVRNIFGPEHIHRHIEEVQWTYFTSGKRGLGLLLPGHRCPPSLAKG